MKKDITLAIVGATGAVGSELLKVLEERNFPYKNLKLMASERSKGKKIDYKGQTYTIEETTEHSFDGVDLALFAGGPASRLYGRLAQEKGCVVIDNSSTFKGTKASSQIPIAPPS